MLTPVQTHELEISHSAHSWRDSVALAAPDTPEWYEILALKDLQNLEPLLAFTSRRVILATFSQALISRDIDMWSLVQKMAPLTGQELMLLGWQYQDLPKVLGKTSLGVAALQPLRI